MADSIYSGALSVAWDGASPAAAPAGSVVQFSTGNNVNFGMDAEGTFVATFILEATIDGTHWYTVPSFSVLDSSSITSTLTAPGRRKFNGGEAVAVRVRCTAWTSGTVNLIFAGTPGGGGSGGSGGGGGGGGGPATIADGSDVAEGTTTDNAITTSTTGATPATVIALLRGAVNLGVAYLLRIPAALTGSGNFKVSLQESTANQAVTNANLDVALSTRTKPGDQQHAIIDSSALPTGAALDATLASILAKIIAAPATEATLALIKTDVDKIPPLTGPYPSTGFAPAAPTATFTRGANTTAYTIGDEVGTAGTAPTTVSVARVNGGSGIIQGASVFFSDYPATVPQLVVLIFSATVTLAGDNAQLLLSDADAAKLICQIPLTVSQSSQYSAGAPVAAGGVWLSGVPARQAPHFVCGGSEVTLYAALITLNAFTAIANSSTLALTLDIEQN